MDRAENRGVTFSDSPFPQLGIDGSLDDPARHPLAQRRSAYGQSLESNLASPVTPSLGNASGLGRHPSPGAPPSQGGTVFRPALGSARPHLAHHCLPFRPSASHGPPPFLPGPPSGGSGFFRGPFAGRHPAPSPDRHPQTSPEPISPTWPPLPPHSRMPDSSPPNLLVWTGPWPLSEPDRLGTSGACFT